MLNKCLAAKTSLSISPDCETAKNKRDHITIKSYFFSVEGVASEHSRSCMSSPYLRRVRTNGAVPCQYIYFLDLWEYAFLITQVIEHCAGGGVLNILVNTQAYKRTSFF